MPLRTIEPQVTELHNGVRVVTAHMPSARRTVVDSRVPVGPRFEDRENNGISHFLEHMLYRGTPRYPSAHKLALAIETLGGTLEAATYADQGELVLSGPTEHLNDLLDIYGDVYQRPRLTDIEVEKDIVHEEILECLDDEGRQVDSDILVHELSFGDHPLGMPITGETRHLEQYTRQSLRAHHRRHYVGCSTVVAVVGPGDPDKAAQKLETVFGTLKKGRPAKATPPPPQSEARFRYVRNISSQTSLRFSFRAPAIRDPQEPATELLLRSLDDGMSTRLYARVCDELGLCYDISADYEGYDDSGIITIGVEAQHDRVERVIDEVFSVVRSLRDDGPTEAELKKAKARHHWQLMELMENPQELAEYFAVSELSDVGRTLGEREASIQACDLRAVRDAGERVFQPGAMSVVAVGTAGVRARGRIARQVEMFD